MLQQCYVRLRWCILGAWCMWNMPAAAQAVDSTADAIAGRIVQASGGAETWAALPFVRFEFKLYRKLTLIYAVQHFWDKKNGTYRMELPGPANEPYVAVFDTGTFEAQVYWKGSELVDKDAAIIMARVRTRYFHDLFFFAFPFLLFDRGVTRIYLPDASTESEDAIQVTMPHWEGLPTTTFHVFADRESGRLVRTSYELPSGDMRAYEWLGYEEYGAVGGTIVLSTRKRAQGHPFLISTEHIMLPPTVESDLLQSPTPVLQPLPLSEEQPKVQQDG